ncbi:T9SS type A sorting domain-containing protein [Altibacter sp.]|uniref:T9SS type A sorting domain-containing protein n=1 Tax=Altibacter sp. TaxID=2024823 RepID=UPI000C9474F0|nr:T9SS type A sorting domain-containing protein [Altibacter sp.]MAP55743.1 hypothetical protein [Altibacter sp.]|tara:strand:- start:295 stop:1002 length:708 start_codon:yes stop_codon:yes gene_type:complete
MKVFYSFIAILCVGNVIAQDPDPQLFENDWYLYSVQINDLDPLYTVSEIKPPIDPYLRIEENLVFSGEGACNSFGGQYEILPDNELNAIDFSETGEDCGEQLHNSFEDSYFGMITHELLYYSITQDGTGSVLTMEHPLFGHAIFKSYPLSILEFNDASFEVFPNPVTDRIFIKLNNDLVVKKVFIYNLQGALVYHETDPPAKLFEIAMENFNSGFYFVKIVGETGNENVQKIIKK